ncbi:MAG: trypsin-like peptidase domain-containing protein [Gemmataceae bacterium]|nr:trypsin-like peptidase domain-containing protein [Gemmataceae bacterium]
MDKQYYIRVRGKVMGPFGTTQLRSLRDRGQFGRFHEVSEDRQNWLSATTVTDLFPAATEVASKTLPPASLPANGRTAPASDWLYVDANGKQQGPVPASQIVSLWQSGAITDGTLVWKEGLSEWGPVSSASIDLKAERFSPHSIGASSINKPGKLLWMVGGISLLLLFGIGGTAAFLIYGKSVSKGISDVVQVAGGNQTITSTTDEKGLTGAVGFVVCGAHVVLADGSQGDEAFGTGSCFAVSGDGHLLTNKHVVEQSWNMRNAKLFLKRMRDEYLMEVQPTVWVFFGKDKYVAEILYVSEDHDVAMLKIDRKHTPFFRLTSADRLPRGKKVAACGFPAASAIPVSAEELVRDVSRKGKKAKIESHFKPRDFEFVLTDGSVSRVFKEDGSDRQWVQHNASINPGNSGGPLIDENGIVVGINTLKHPTAQGTFMSLAIPQLRSEIEKQSRGLHWE